MKNRGCDGKKLVIELTGAGTWDGSGAVGDLGQIMFYKFVVEYVSK